MDKTRTIAPIDEKNVCTDWIEQIFDDCNVVCTTKHHMNKVCGFVDGVLVECVYQSGHNEMNWYVYGLQPDQNSAISKLKTRLLEFEDNDSDLYSEIADHDSYLSQRFYFVADEPEHQYRLVAVSPDGANSEIGITETYPHAYHLAESYWNNSTIEKTEKVLIIRIADGEIMDGYPNK